MPKSHAVTAAHAILEAHKVRTAEPATAALSVPGVLQAGETAAAGISQFLQQHPEMGPDIWAAVQAIETLL